LAESDRTALQAFRLGRATYGIQFHFEADRALVEKWSADFAPVIATYAPEWQRHLPAEAARHAAAAAAAGAAIARAWVGLLRYGDVRLAASPASAGSRARRQRRIARQRQDQ
jgi:GMP synthase (glutamine-hydrolysing)